MLLKSLNVLNSRGSLLELPLEDSTNGFKVKSIEGLDPVAATLSSSSFANLDGEQYYSSRRQKRNIKIKLGLDPNFAVMDVKELRDQLYAYFMPKSEIQMTFNMFDRFTNSFLAQNLNLDITGRIETFETPLFAQEPEVDISIICFNPDFVDPNLVSIDGNTVNDTTDTIITYDGTVDTGVVITIYPNRDDLAQVTIYQWPPDATYRVTDFLYPMLYGDVVAISSVAGSKSALLTRAGVITSVLYGIQPTSGWITLAPGDNRLRVYAAGAAVPYKLEYLNKYGGL